MADSADHAAMLLRTLQCCRGNVSMLPQQQKIGFEKRMPTKILRKINIRLAWTTSGVRLPDLLFQRNKTGPCGSFFMKLMAQRNPWCSKESPSGDWADAATHEGQPSVFSFNTGFIARLYPCLLPMNCEARIPPWHECPKSTNARGSIRQIHSVYTPTQFAQRAAQVPFSH